jgi:hypothetical protein
VEILIKGTYRELNTLSLWTHDQFCQLIHVDPYKLCMVGDNEVFTITADDLKRVGLIEE